MQYKDSKDPKVVEAGIKVRSGRKWSTTKELNVLEKCQWQKKKKKILIDVVAKRSGLSYFLWLQIKERFMGCKFFLVLK